jgi:hypothetical protein
MGSIFRSPPPVVVSTPQQSATSGSTEIKPFKPVIPFIEGLLDPIQQQFSADPALFTGSLVPTDSAQTLAARNIYDQVGQQAAAFAPIYQNLFQQDLGIATGDINQDPLHLARTQAIANQARQMTERDKLTAQQQAIQAGQFGLGSTALKEFEANQQIRREDLAQQQLAKSLQEAEARRLNAQGRLGGLAQAQLQAQMTPATLQEAMGRDVESRQAALQQDAARLAQQDQEARRAQLVTMANLFGGLAGLGSSTQMQQTSSGFGSQGFGGGPSTASQIAGLVGAAAGFSDKRLKTKIKLVGRLANGIKLYKWEWTEKGKELVGNQVEFGVIAQEVEKIMPEAVMRGSDGYLRVNYSMLEV